jgi:ribosomal protein L12E/L44/L45/RPP1/RPP2
MPQINLAQLESAVSVNSFLIGSASDTAASLLVQVLDFFASFRSALESRAGQTLDQGTIDTLVSQLEGSNGTLETVLTTMQKISETAAQTSPITDSPEAPIPATEPTPIENPTDSASEGSTTPDPVSGETSDSTDVVPELPTIEEIPVEIVPSPPDIGLEGSFEINPYDYE